MHLNDALKEQCVHLLIAVSLRGVKVSQKMLHIFVRVNLKCMKDLIILSSFVVHGCRGIEKRCLFAKHLQHSSYFLLSNSSTLMNQRVAINFILVLVVALITVVNAAVSCTCDLILLYIFSVDTLERLRRYVREDAVPTPPPL